MTEGDIMRSIMIALSAAGATVWRNNTGKLQDKTGRWVRFGLCEGSSDIIGIAPVIIAPEMVGRTLAVFTAIEVKRPGKKATPEQVVFIEAVRRKGGIAGVADSVDAAKKILDDALAKG